MTAAAVRGVASFPSQNVANLVWAYASLGREPGPALAAAVQERVLTILTEFTPKVIPQTQLLCSASGLQAATLTSKALCQAEVMISLSAG